MWLFQTEVIVKDFSIRILKNGSRVIVGKSKSL